MEKKQETSLSRAERPAVGERPESSALLELRSLRVDIRLVDDRTVNVVDDVSIEVYRNEAVGIIGESGSGKSMTANSILRLIPEPGEIAGGEILLDGRDLLEATDKEIGRVRGGEIAIVFQDAMTYVNPVLSIGDQITEVVRRHTAKRRRREAQEAAVDLLTRVGIPEPRRRMGYYPHQLSGGQTQRVAIAIALAGNPRLVIADEPTTALDVMTQGQILDLLKTISKDEKVSLLVITHDVSVVARLCQRIYVMYAGQIVEHGAAAEIIERPKHPYTQGLIESVPRIENWESPIPYMRGSPPDPSDLPPGCRFVSRCPYAMERCSRSVPALMELGEAHQVRCYLYGDSHG